MRFPSDEAIAIYRRFKALPGSEHIGKPVSIDALIGMCRRLRASHIVEMGCGIGALSYTLLAHSDAFVDIYEDNEFCQKALAENLKEFAGRFRVIDTYRLLPPSLDYELAVIDGGTGQDKDGGHRLAACHILLGQDRLSGVYIEGYRGLQRDLVRSTLRDRYACYFIPHKDLYVDGKKWAGGLEVRCIRTDSVVRRWGSFLLFEALARVRALYFRLRALARRRNPVGR